VGVAGIFALRRLAVVSHLLFPAGGVLGLLLFGLALGALLGTPEVAVLPIGLPAPSGGQPNWLPDAHAEGPTPVSAVLSGLLLNVALYAVLRCKVLTDGALQSHLAGRLMMGFGLLSVVAAVFFLIRQKDVKRMFAYSSIEHMGMMTFAFGMGGPIANFAGCCT